MPTTIYLDNNATTRPFPEVIDAIARHLRESFGNPGSRHVEGRRARRALEEARESVAGILGAKPTEVVFTSGGTEATNLALFGLAGALFPSQVKGIQEGSAPSASLREEHALDSEQTESGATGSAPRDLPQPPLIKGGTRGPIILLTRGEHPATLEACRHLERQGWRLHFLDVDGGGRLREEQFDSLPWNEVKLATVILAHNETGVIQDLAPLASHCRAHGIPLHVDAVQAVGKIPVDFHDLGATTLSLGAHKFHGPRGVGVLLVREGVTLAPLLFGGHQEAERRPGTESVALAIGMARALELWQTNRERRTRHVEALRDRLETGLLAACAPAVVNGSREHRLPNTLNIAFPGLDGEAILVALDLEGVCCSLGSTCASGSAEPAPALVAMGCPPEVYRASVRFSVGVENTADEIDEAVRRVSSVVSRLRSHRSSVV